MKDWLDYERRFRELVQAFRFVRLDVQTGGHGEFWRLAGGYDRALFDQFEALCRLAGEQLTAVWSSTPEMAALLDEPDPKIRWYRAMKEQPGAYETSFPAYTEDEHGVKTWIYSGSIQRVPETAANLCLSLHRTHPIRTPSAPEPSKLSKFWESYGREIVIGVIVSVISLAIGLVIGGGA